jgi:hypothetical protein
VRSQAARDAVFFSTDASGPTGSVGSPRDWTPHVLYRVFPPLLTEAWKLDRSNGGVLRGFGAIAQRRLALDATDVSRLARWRVDPRLSVSRSRQPCSRCLAASALEQSPPGEIPFPFQEKHVQSGTGFPHIR